MASFSADDLSKHPRAVLGPRFAAAVIQGFETGLISNLAYRFWKEDYAEKRFIQLILLFVTVLSYVQTALTFYGVYDKFVIQFADWSKMLTINWSFKVHLLVTFLLAMPTKALFIWRCYKLAKQNHRRHILILHSVLYMGEIVSWILVTIKAFTSGLNRHIANDPVVICAFSLPLALDIALTCTLLTLILPSRPRIITRSITTTIYRLSFIVWETNLPSTLCMLLSLTMYLTLVSKGYWADLFQDVVGQTYIISLFVVLMGMQMTSGGHAQQKAADFSLTSLSMTWRIADTPSATHAPGFELESLPASLRSGLSSVILDFDFDSPRDGPGHRHAQPAKAGSSFVSNLNPNRGTDEQRGREGERATDQR